MARGTAGYSGTPLARKLGIKPGATVALLGAPAGFEKELAPLPGEVSLKRQARAQADVIVLFARNTADLTRRFGAAHRALAEGGGLWVAWPKQTSPLHEDLSRDDVRKLGLEAGLVDNKICAVNETWSGLRFMRRRA